MRLGSDFKRKPKKEPKRDLSPMTEEEWSEAREGFKEQLSVLRLDLIMLKFTNGESIRCRPKKFTDTTLEDYLLNILPGRDVKACRLLDVETLYGSVEVVYPEFISSITKVKE